MGTQTSIERLDFKENTYYRRMITGLVLFTIALGVFFIMIEIFLIPGTTIFGVAGAGAIVAALYFAYTNEPAWLGNVALLSTVGLSIIMFFLGKKMAQSQTLSLVEKEIKGRVNEQEHFEDVELGNTGTAISALRPNGTIKINGNRFEAQAQNGYIQSGAYVTVVEIQHQKLIVQIVQE